MTSISKDTTSPHFPLWTCFFVLLLALLARLWLLTSGALSFHSDEAIVGLMARHILQGERPAFFYGQPYMGSLDAWLIALGFRLLGDSLMTMRIVESLLYLLVVVSGFIVAWRFSGRALVAATAGLLLAVPPVNAALYTTATLGGYNETLLLGSWMLLLAHDLTGQHARSPLRWALLGLCAGVGWWTNGLIMVYAAPIALVILYTHLRARTVPSVLPLFALALVAFCVGSAPWWVFDFNHNHAALGIYLSSRQSGEFEGIGIPYVPPLQRALGLVVIGLPALIGMRFPWSSDYFAAFVGIAVVLVYGVALYRLRRVSPLIGSARALTAGMLGLFCLLFVGSTFGADPTGRYFVPLGLPLGILLGTLVVGLLPEQASPELAKALRRNGVRLIAALLLVLLVVGYQAAGEIAAAAVPPGYTTQFDPISHIPNDHDAELIAFLESHDLLNGYTNYWVAFRLAFLSNERLEYRSALPYKSNMSYNAADDRYQPYKDATDQAARVAYITTNLPELDAILESSFAEQGISWQQVQIGLFHIYYDFQPDKPALEKVKSRLPQTGF